MSLLARNKKVAIGLLSAGVFMALSACGDGGGVGGIKGNMLKATPTSLQNVSQKIDPEGSEGFFNVECTLSHTLPDDPIKMFGRPGDAMVHDFFGNIHADAFTTVDKLLAQPETTCTSTADGSSYWAPQMQRKSTGEIIKPDHMKAYYRNQDTRYPVEPFPKGLQLLVGDHHSSQSKQGVLYFCKTSESGGSYYSDPPQSCPLYDGKKAQFNITLNFPNCWDGKRLNPGKSGPRNAAYSVNGACPTEYPVKIPQIQMNIGYVLPGNGNISDLELSMNPDMQGGVAIPVWGSLYTAHGDFFNGWRADTIDFMTEFCLNRGVLCDKNIPVVNALAADDAYVRGGAYADTNYGSDKQMLSQEGSAANPDETKVAYMKFKLPDEETLKNAPYKDVFLRFQGMDQTSKKAYAVWFYEASPDWDEKTITQKTGPKCGGKNYVRAWMSSPEKFIYRNSASVAQIVDAARQREDRTVSLCMMASDSDNQETILGTKESGSPVVLFFK
ncbi:DUF1996 domain-containing protein [Paraburkholderia hayleyella]|uniref:DUF1996 domain-containing protein n=1 Tax=Paraburkholderia hayleyella TaxID=2152889 RepID=UPI001C65FB1D|nr:DUF1996 domain-containing protein [Paraburkholderia hayleyella]